MQELVIVIPDLYLPPDEASAAVAAPVSPAGLGQLTRFAAKAVLPDGWRSWLARWVGRDDLAAAAPAAVASAGLDPAPAASASAAGFASAWFATPLYLIAGLTSIHTDRRSLLRLPAADLARLAADFATVFSEDGLLLKPISSGEFIMLNMNTPEVRATEPARALVADLNESLPNGPGAPALKRLSAELEMWLHSHPSNQARQQRGELPVSTLWLWGGGELKSLPPISVAATVSDLAYGADPYLTGLWRLLGSAPLPLPDTLTDVVANSRAQRAVLVAEVTPALHANPHWTIAEALGDLDRRFLVPALAGLRQGRVENLTVLLNDRHFRLRRRDELRFWRRRSRGLEGLR